MMKPPKKNLPNAGNKLYYFAHPYGSSPFDNVEESIKQTNILLDLGFKIFNPLTHSHYLDIAKKRETEFWYNLDVIIMEKMDGIIMAPNWQESRGCLMEFGYMLGAKKEIHFYEDIINAFKPA